MRKIIYSLVILLSCEIWFPVLAVADEALSIGVFPRRNATKTISYFKPLELYLSKKLNRKVILKTSKNFTTFWRGVENGEYDLVHFNQYHYMVSHQKFGYEVILKNKELGEATISGSIIVRKDSGINNVKDLAGKSIVFGGGPKAMQSYIYARYLLESKGLNRNDYSIRFAKNPPNAIIATFLKQAAAAGSGDKVLQLGVVTNSVDISQLKYLVKGEQHAHLPWAVSKAMPSKLKHRIQSILANMKNTVEGQKVLNSAKLDSLELATDEEYNPHRLIVEKVLGEKY